MAKRKRSADADIDRLISRGLVNANIVSESLRRELLDKLSKLHGTADYVRMLDVARDILRGYEPLLAQVLSDVELGAWIVGADEIVRELPDDVRKELARQIDLAGAAPVALPPLVPPAEPPVKLKAPAGAPEPKVQLTLIDGAVKDLRSRRIVTRADFDRLSNAAKRAAFTVAHQNSELTLATIRDSVAASVATGSTLDDFREDMAERLGASPIGPAHSENVFRTNVMQSYQNGSDEILNNPIVDPVFPYLAYSWIDDSRVRPTHREFGKLGLNGTSVYRKDDPVWRRWKPSNGFMCRCKAIALTVRQAAQRGVEEAIRWLESGEPPESPEWRDDAVRAARVDVDGKLVPVEPDKGFGE